MPRLTAFSLVRVTVYFGLLPAVAACGESHFVDPPDAPIDGTMEYTELGEADARALCEWWDAQWEKVLDGRFTECGMSLMPVNGIDSCVRVRLEYGERAGCRIPVRTFYECGSVERQYCISIPDECRLDMACSYEGEEPVLYP